MGSPDAHWSPWTPTGTKQLAYLHRLGRQHRRKTPHQAVPVRFAAINRPQSNRNIKAIAAIISHYLPRAVLY